MNGLTPRLQSNQRAGNWWDDLTNTFDQIVGKTTGGVKTANGGMPLSLGGHDTANFGPSLITRSWTPPQAQSKPATGAQANSFFGLNRQTQPQESQQPTFMDLLASLQNELGGSSLQESTSNPFVSYDPARQEAQSSASAASAALQGIYGQLNRELGNAGNAITDRYASAGEAINTNRDQATAATQDAYAATQAQQAGILNQLGIQNEVARAIQDGRDLSGRGADAVANIQQGSAANADFNTATGAAEGAYNGRLQQAGSAAGARAQTDVQSNLQSVLAEIAMAEQQANAQQQSSSSSATGGMAMGDLTQLAQWMWENQQEQDRNVQDDALDLQNTPSAKLAARLQLLQRPEVQALDPDILKYIFG